MKIAPLTLDDRDREARREIIENKISGGHWYACVASVDLRYVAPITAKNAKGLYEISRPIEFRRLGIKGKMKKFFSDIRRDGEKMIFEAAAIREESPPLLTIFGPMEKKRLAWKRTRNVFDCQQQPASIEVRRFRPQEIGWRHCIRRVMSLDLSPAAKILLLYAYDRGFQSGEFYASSKTASEETGIHEVHVKRILPHLAKLKHLERVKRDPPKGVWRYALLAPVHELPRSNLKLPDEGMERDAGNLKLPPAITLSANSGNLSLPKADKANKKDSSRSTRDAIRSYCERELLDHLARVMGPSEMVNNGAMWRLRIRFYHLAITSAIKEYYGLSQNERDKIEKRAAWITDRYFSYGGKSVEKGEVVELAAGFNLT
jgi:hypothetical protein